MPCRLPGAGRGEEKNRAAQGAYRNSEKPESLSRAVLALVTTHRTRSPLQLRSHTATPQLRARRSISLLALAAFTLPPRRIALRDAASASVATSAPSSSSSEPSGDAAPGAVPGVGAVSGATACSHSPASVKLALRAPGTNPTLHRAKPGPAGHGVSSAARSRATAGLAASQRAQAFAPLRRGPV
jgi:hypothetical protein